jgi:pimeloyl-ACP methyl ester carboxylesterase
VRISSWLTVLTLWLVAAPVAAQPAGMDPQLLKPHLVRLADGRRINVHCVGRGSPAVVFLQGGEGMIFNWAKVQPAVSAITRTCLYDRGGFGWSDPPRYPVTALTVTDELHDVLSRAGVREPVVLVGHSIGGFYATMYADRFPQAVAAMVLVDPGFAGQSSGAEGERAVVEQGNFRRGEGDLVRCAELARRGKLDAGNLAEHHCYTLPSDARDAATAAYALHAITGPHWYEAEHSQSVNYFSADGDLSVSHQQERDAARSFADMPLVVLSRDIWVDAPWRSPADAQSYRDRWRAGHVALAARSSRGRFAIVPGSDHFIQKDQPDAVIDAIREVVTAVRDGGRTAARGTTRARP